MSMSKHVVSKVKVKPLVDALMVEIRNDNLKSDPRAIYHLIAKSQGFPSWKAFANQSNLHTEEAVENKRLAAPIIAIEKARVHVKTSRIGLNSLEIEMTVLANGKKYVEVLEVERSIAEVQTKTVSFSVRTQPSRNEEYLEFISLMQEPACFVKLFEGVRQGVNSFAQELQGTIPDHEMQYHRLDKPVRFASLLLTALTNRPYFSPHVTSHQLSTKLITFVDAGPHRTDKPLMLQFGFNAKTNQVELINADEVEVDLGMEAGKLNSMDKILSFNELNSALVGISIGAWFVSRSMDEDVLPWKASSIKINRPNPEGQSYS